MMRITALFESERHEIELDVDSTTVEGFSDLVETSTGVPTRSQKIIFKGKSISIGQIDQNDLESPVLSKFNFKNGSKVKVLGSKKSDPEMDAFNVALKKEDIATSTVAEQLKKILAQVENYDKGFLDAVKEDAEKRLEKDILGCIEGLERGLERIDALHASTSEMRTRRKESIVYIQKVLTEADTLSDRLKMLVSCANSSGAVPPDID